MNDVILKLIRIITELTMTPGEHIKARDMHYQIVLDYNYGKPLWYLEHDGYVWNMETYVPPSRNGFKTFKQAESVMIETLLRVAKDAIENEKEGPNSHPNLIELEIEYLVLEIAS